MQKALGSEGPAAGSARWGYFGAGVCWPRGRGGERARHGSGTSTGRAAAHGADAHRRKTGTGVVGKRRAAAQRDRDLGLCRLRIPSEEIGLAGGLTSDDVIVPADWSRDRLFSGPTAESRHRRRTRIISSEVAPTCGPFAASTHTHTPDCWHPPLGDILPSWPSAPKDQPHRSSTTDHDADVARMCARLSHRASNLAGVAPPCISRASRRPASCGSYLIARLWLAASFPLLLAAAYLSHGVAGLVLAAGTCALSDFALAHCVALDSVYIVGHSHAPRHKLPMECPATTDGHLLTCSLRRGPWVTPQPDR